MNFQTKRPGDAGDVVAAEAQPNLRDLLAEAYPDDELLFLDPASLDVAVVGVAERLGLGPVVVYDRQKLVQVFMDDGMSEEEALEWIGYSIEGAYVGESTPLLLTGVDAIRNG